MNPRRLVLFVALALMLGGSLLMASDIIEASVERRSVRFDGPRDVQGQTLRLRESRDVSGLSVDLMWGEETVATDLPVLPDARAEQDDYVERYANQLWLYAPRPTWLPWHLVIADRSAAEPKYSRYVLNAAAPLETARVSGDVSTMRADFNRELLRRPERAGLRFIVSPPAMVLFGALIWLLRPGPRLRAAPTMALVFAMAALASFVAWPVMMHTGPSRSLPPALLATGITLLVALGFGPRWQTALAARSGALRLAGGVLIALVLLAVFTLAWVQINGFIAPIYRPPGAGLSPGEWFVQDIVAPSLAVGGLGLLPALLAGAVYGVYQNDKPGAAPEEQ